MPKFAICNETYVDWPFDQACADIAAAGYDGVEIAPFTLADDPRELTRPHTEQTRAIAEGHGLTIVGLHWMLAKTQGLHLTCEDNAVREATTAYAIHLANLCSAMGGHIMVWGSPQQRSFDPEAGHEAAYERAAGVLRRVAEAAGDVGVTIAFEPLGPNETNFINTADEAKALIDRVDHPACRLHLDVKAMASEDRPITQIIAEHAARTAHFHANDPNLRGPGQGEVDFHPIAQKLLATNYSGWVSVEVFDYTPDAPTIARQSIACLRESFDVS